MRIYLAGPMSHRKDFNFPAFMSAAKRLREKGHTVFNPAEEDLKTWGTMAGVRKHANYRDCLRKDLNWILDHAEAVYVLPNWRRSKGVRAEKALAKALGIPIVHLQKV